MQHNINLLIKGIYNKPENINFKKENNYYYLLEDKDIFYDEESFLEIILNNVFHHFKNYLKALFHVLITFDLLQNQLIPKNLNHSNSLFLNYLFSLIYYFNHKKNQFIFHYLILNLKHVILSFTHYLCFIIILFQNIH